MARTAAVWIALSAIIFIVMILLAVILFASDKDEQLPCEFLDSIDISDGVKYENGTIVHDGYHYEPTNYALIDYNFNESGAKIQVNPYLRGCVCQVRQCVWLCCRKESVSYAGKIPTCMAYGDNYELLVQEVNDSGELQILNIIEKYHLLKAVRVSSHDMFEAGHDEWNMNPNGSVNSVGEASFAEDEYCFELATGNLSTLYFKAEPSEIVQLPMVAAIGIIISIPFLVATLLIYACIPELRNIHGKSLICYVLALTLTYILLALNNFRLEFIPCAVRGFMLYFFVLVSFFWLNVMCFDIFWTFSSGVVIKNERKRFRYYSLYAWGFPLLILGLTLIFEHTELVKEDFRPRFGNTSCFFINDKMVEFTYLYLPLLLLVILNLYFFVVTAVRIVRVQKATDAALKNESCKHSKFEKDRYRFTLYLRLFIVMGVTWTFEIISWALGNEHLFFYVTDACNCLLGMIIFFLFVWKHKVRKLIIKRIGRHNEHRRTKSINTSTSGSKYTSVQDTTTVSMIQTNR